MGDYHLWHPWWLTMTLPTFEAYVTLEEQFLGTR